jgi:hypothetical protein
VRRSERQADLRLKTPRAISIRALPRGRSY